MAHVTFTPHLRRYFDLPDACDVPADDVASVVRELDTRWPGIGFYNTDERGRLRQHVAVWVDGALLKDRETLGGRRDDRLEGLHPAVPLGRLVWCFASSLT